MKSAVVLDASALLAALFGETGQEKVFAVIGRAAISAVNYTEVITRQMRLGATRELAVSTVSGLNLRVIPWDEELAEAAADLNALSWSHGLSLGDRACLATGLKLGVPTLTADREWRQLPDLGVKIDVIR